MLSFRATLAAASLALFSASTSAALSCASIDIDAVASYAAITDGLNDRGRAIEAGSDADLLLIRPARGLLFSPAASSGVQSEAAAIARNSGPSCSAVARDALVVHSSIDSRSGSLRFAGADGANGITVSSAFGMNDFGQIIVSAGGRAAQFAAMPAPVQVPFVIWLFGPLLLGAVGWGLEFNLPSGATAAAGESRRA